MKYQKKQYLYGTTTIRQVHSGNLKIERLNTKRLQVCESALAWALASLWVDTCPLAHSLVFEWILTCALGHSLLFDWKHATCTISCNGYQLRAIDKIIFCSFSNAKSMIWIKRKMGHLKLKTWVSRLVYLPCSHWVTHSTFISTFQKAWFYMKWSKERRVHSECGHLAALNVALLIVTGCPAQVAQQRSIRGWGHCGQIHDALRPHFP